MADLYWVGGNNTWNGTAGTKWATSSGGAGGAAAPTAADNVFFTNLSTGPCTVASGAVCRSLDCNGYTGTLTITSFTLAIGDGTAGSSNRILRFGTGMTVSGNTAGNITLQSTSGTQQDVNLGGKSVPGTLTFGGAGSSYDVSSSTGGAVQNITHSAGTLSFSGGGITCSGGGFTCNSGSTRTLTLGTATITIAGSWTVTTSGLTFSSATGSTITITSANATFAGGGLTTYGTVQWTGSTIALASMTGANTFVNLKLAPSVGGKADSMNFGAGQTITGTLTVTGTSRVNQILLYTSLVGSPFTLTAAGLSLTNVDFLDIFTAGTASPFTGTSLGDCGGNSGITFTAAQPQFWIGGTGNQSSTTKYSQSTGGPNDGRIPLPQDNLTFDGSSGSGTATFDMPRLCKNLDASNSSVTTFAETAQTLGHGIYGNISFKAGMTLTLTSDTLSLRGRGSQTITSNANSINGPVTVLAPGGTYTLQDNFSLTGTVFTVASSSTFDANGFTVSVTTFAASGTATVKFGGAAWTITGGGGGTAYSVANTNTLTIGATVITFTSTSGTATLTGGTTQTNPPITFDGVGGTWSFSAGSTFGAATLTNGSLTTNSQNLTFTSFSSNNSNVRTFTLAGGTLTLSGVAGWDTTTTTNLTNGITGGSIILNGANAQFYGGGLTFKAVTMSGAAIASVKGTNTFTTFTRTGTNTQHEVLQLFADQTCSTSFVCNGNAVGARVIVLSDTQGVTRTITAAAVTITNCDFRDITGAGAGTWSNASPIGDCGGNSGISFAVGQNNFWRSGAGNASTASKWSLTSGGASGGRPPLPQDTAKFDANSGTGAVTYDMLRLGAVDLTNSSVTSITFPYDSVAIGIVELYGSFTGKSTVTLGWDSSAIFVFQSRSSKTYTQNASTSPPWIVVLAIGGTWTLGGNITGSPIFTLSAGTFSDGGFNMTVQRFGHLADSNSRTLTLTGTITPTQTSVNPWTITNDANTAVNMSTATLQITSSSSSSRQIWQGKGIIGTLTLTGGGSGAITITNGTATNLTCGTLNIGAGQIVTLAAGSTTTVTSAINISGSSGSHAILNSSSPGSAATLSSGGTVTVTYAEVTDNTAAGASINFVDQEGVSGGGNTNWNFQYSFSEAEGLTDANLFRTTKIVASEAAGSTDAITTTATKVLGSESEGLTDASSRTIKPPTTSDSSGITDEQIFRATKVLSEAEDLSDPTVYSVTKILETDNEGLTDVVGKEFPVTMSDNEGITDSKYVAVPKDISDIQGSTDSVVYRASKILSETEGLTDVATEKAKRVQSDNEGLVDTTSRSATRLTTDPVGLIDSRVFRATGVLAEAIGLTDSSARTIKPPTVSDLLGSADSLVASAKKPLSDSLGLTDPTVRSGNYIHSLSDNVGLTDSISKIVDAIISDAVGATDSIVVSMRRALAESLGFTDAIVVTAKKVLSDNEGATDSFVKSTAAQITDQLGETDTITKIVTLGAIVDPLDETDSIVTTRTMILMDGEDVTDALDNIFLQRWKPILIFF